MSGDGDWAVYMTARQDLRHNMYDLENMMGRTPSATPTHLSRVLYLPRHADDDVSHLPLYDISKRVKDAIGETPMGSSMYTVKLGTMARPKGDGTDEVDVSYLVYFERLGGVVSAKVQRTGPLKGDNDDEVSLKINVSPEDAGSLGFKEPFGTGEDVNVAVGVSYPIPASVTRVGTIAHPYFTFEVPGVFGQTVFQWQIHPKENGSLRYTLMAIPTRQEETEQVAGEAKQAEAETRAIYHHIGLGASLSQGYSEGVLHLPSRTEGSQSESEGVIVASLLTMLWRLRNIDGGKGSKIVVMRGPGNTSTSKTSVDGTGSAGGKKLGFLHKLKGKKVV